MKEHITYLSKSILLAIGVILCLSALSFLIKFTDYASLENIKESDFLTFIVLTLVGIPTLMLGIHKLSVKP